MSAQGASDEANPFPDLLAIRGPDANPLPSRPVGPATRRFPSPRFGVYSRTRFESRAALGGPDEDEDTDAGSDANLPKGHRHRGRHHGP